MLLNPAAIAATASVFSPYLTTDRGLDSGTVASLGIGLRGVRGSDVHTYRLLQSGFSRVDGQSVVLLDEGALHRFRTALRADDLAAYSG